MSGKTYTLEQIERHVKAIAAMLATSSARGSVTFHKGTAPGQVSIDLNLTGDPEAVIHAAGILTACSLYDHPEQVREGK